MAIYQVCKAALASITLVSATVLSVSCSHMDHTNPSSASAANNTADATGGHTAEGSSDSHAAGDHAAGDHAHAAGEHADASVKKTVNTNHDIYHSKAIEVPAGTPVPAVSVRVDTDSVRGWNLYVGTANFTFTPADVNGESRPTGGHAHLYINDKSVQRIYSTWTHLPDLPAGKNEIRVTLNANGHETLTTQGAPIEETVTVEVYKPE